jgi:glycosyltransferase involved in cell wall biosynthesis
VRPYAKNISLARLASHRDFGRTFERLANESIASGQLERPDIILASLPPLEGPEAAARLAKRLDANLVVELMEVWPETFERLLPGPQWLRKTLYPLLFGRMATRRRALLEAADAVSSSAHGYLAAMPEATAGDKPRHVCYLGAWVPEFAGPPRLIDEVPNTDAAAAPVDQPAAAPVSAPLACVYSGTLESGQDLDALLAAARILSAQGIVATLHVAGTGRLESSLRTAAEAIRGSCTVRVHGLLERGAYVRLVSECDVGLVLVRPESRVVLPNKACDYAAAGLALVNSLPGELQQFIDTHAAGLPYAAGDGAALAKAIATLAADRRLLKDMRQHAVRLAAAEFDRERLYPQFAAWLETVSG